MGLFSRKPAPIPPAPIPLAERLQHPAWTAAIHRAGADAGDGSFAAEFDRVTVIDKGGSMTHAELALLVVSGTRLVLAYQTPSGVNSVSREATDCRVMVGRFGDLILQFSNDDLRDVWASIALRKGTPAFDRVASAVAAAADGRAPVSTPAAREGEGHAAGADRLAAARELMARWERSLGDNDSVWKGLEDFSRLGGYRGYAAYLDEVARSEHGDAAALRGVLDRPWVSWAGTVAHAQAAGDHVLVAKIFLFTELFVREFAPRMRQVDPDVGLVAPLPETRARIARAALESLALLHPGMMVHESRTGQVDVAGAIDMARQSLA